MHRQKSLCFKKSAQRGVVIIEAMVAILIISFALLGLVGLQATMIKNTAESEYRAVASYIAQQRIGEMWADPANLAAYAGTTINVSHRLPNGLVTVAQAAANQYTITVTWQAPNEALHNFATTAIVVGGS